MRVRSLGSRIKLFVLSILSIILYSIFYINPVYAQTTSQPTTSKESKPTFEVSTPNFTPVNTYNVSPTSPLFTDLIVYNLFHTFGCFSIGNSPIGQPCLSYQVSKDAQGAVTSIPVLSSVNLSGGALGSLSSVMTMLYNNPPVRTSEYVAFLGRDFGMVKEAHAQIAGSGAGVLDPIISLWQVSRNISFVIMIIIFVVIGLMVMFRQRINPQTVITAQAALPGLIIGLVLITFSYFMAALITDMAFVGTNLVGYYFIAAQPTATQENLVDKMHNKNVLIIVSSLIKGIRDVDMEKGTADFFQALGPSDITDTSNPTTLIKIAASFIGYQVGSPIASAIGGIGGGLLCGVGGIAAIPFTAGASLGLAAVTPACTGVGSLLGSIGGGGAIAYKTWNDPGVWVGWGLWVLAIIIIIYAMVQLLRKLIMNYLNIIFLTITAPFHFLAASLPGRQGLTTNWILNMLCNVLAFPAVVAVFYFVNYLLGSTYIPNSPFQVTNSGSITGKSTLPLLGGLDLDFIRLVLAFGALVATPSIPDIVCRTIGKVGVAGQLIGQELSESTRAGRGYLSQTQGGMGAVRGDISRTGGLFDQKGFQTVMKPGGGFESLPTKTAGPLGNIWRAL